MDESWQVFENLEKLGGPTWFRLGDRDLATHLERSRRLKAGEPLSQVTHAFCAAWGIGPAVLPMSDQPVPTIVLTDEGELAFQEYFVARHFEPKVNGFRFEGAAQARPAPGLLEAIAHADLVVFCPSNPWVSIDPILAVPGIREAIASKKVIAVSPIIGGDVIKGPAAKMYADLGMTPSAAAVAKHYEGLLTAFVLDEVDRNLAQKLDVQTYVSDTIMETAAHRRRLAEEILVHAKDL
jgi:LPPG:FO 2-phospho-L-lactate transferase